MPNTYSFKKVNQFNLNIRIISFLKKTQDISISIITIYEIIMPNMADMIPVYFIAKKRLEIMIKA